MNGFLADWTIATDYLGIDWATLTLLIISAVLAVVMRNLLASIAALGIFSLLMALLYLLLDAPDVALTEAAVGAGISTVLFLCAMAFTAREEKTPNPAHSLPALVVVIVIGSALIYATAELPAFASPDAPAQHHVAPYFIEYTKEDIHIPNMVTAILASYRGFDTMGEVGVIFIAGIALMALLMNIPQIRKTPDRNEDDI